MTSQPLHPFDLRGKKKLPLLLTLGGMILLGITTTALGFLFWPDPKPHHDTSTEGFFEKPAAPQQARSGRARQGTTPDLPAPGAAPAGTGAASGAAPAAQPAAGAGATSQDAGPADPTATE